MIIGVPKEIKRDEYRVGLLPVGVEELTRAGHQVLVEAGAGLGSGLADHDYRRHGAELVASPAEVYGRADMIVKVKEPQPSEMAAAAPRPDRLHLLPLRRRPPADRGRARTRGCTAVAYETLRDDHGPAAAADADERSGRPDEHPGRGQVPRTAADGPRHPAGRRARRRAGPHHDPRRRHGRAPTPPRSPPASAPTSAILDINMDRLRYLDDIMPPNVDRAVQRPAHDPRAAPPGRPGDRRRAGSRRQGPAADRARRPAS